MAFAQYLGGSVLLAIASSVFRTELASNLEDGGYTGNVTAIVSGGTADIRQIVQPGDLTVVLTEYNDAITPTYVSCAYPCTLYSNLPLLVDRSGLWCRRISYSIRNALDKCQRKEFDWRWRSLRSIANRRL